MVPVRPNPTLSDDLISEILKRVPVKSLLCFQSVSKTWLSLIKHPAFVKAQLRHTLATQPDQTVIKHQTFSLLDVVSSEIVGDLKFPYSRGEVQNVYNSYIVGSANGIVCVVIGLDGSRFDIYFWNPAIRQSKVIASLISTDDDMYFFTAFGFGYDGVDDDFKVVSLVYNDHVFYYEVSSENRNVRRHHVEPIDYICKGPFHFNVCINGFLYGIGNYDMLVFDLNREVMNCRIKLPVINDAHAQELMNCAIKIPGINDDHDYGIDDTPSVVEFNNSVAVIMPMGFDNKINVWTLNDDAYLQGGGVEASWTPMFSIDLGKTADLAHGYFSNGNLLVVLRINGATLWIMCNADTKEAKIVPLSSEIADHHYTRELFKYTESLVSLEGFKQVNWDDGEDNN